ncbi:MAG: Holliday junction branch migration protein RuvA [Rhabdochlamydiaceae bacterium]|nr:Holliday junction branch migration protein RuvA [Candidatus Amphrikana amoebophyrae]
MYEYIIGKCTSLSPESAIIETGGIGYLIYIPLSAFSQKLSIGKEVKLYLSPVYREDSQKLFGFLTQQERETFKKLSSISGIGPKTALSLVGHMSLDEFRLAITTANAKLISKVPGIGKKTAERVIIEMRDKVGIAPKASMMPLTNPEDHMISDGVNALINLGYNNDKALKAVQKAIELSESEPKLEWVIKHALQII